DRACAHRLGACDVNLGDAFGTRNGRDTPAFGVDLHGDDAAGRAEGFGIAVLAISQRARHEFAPDRRGGLRAFQVKVAAVVESHPDDALQFAGEPREPAVTRRAGLTGSRDLEIVFRAYGRASAAAQYLFH